MRHREPFRRYVAAAVTACCALLVATASAVAPIPDDGMIVMMFPAPAEPRPTEPRPTGTRRAEVDRRSLDRSLDRYLDERPGRLSVAVRDLATGLAYARGTKLRPGTASIVKVQIVMALLLLARREDRALTASERALAERAIKVSDNDAATALWHAIGGGEGLAKAGRRLGLKHTEPGPGTAWGATTTSAADQVRLLTALTSRESPLSARDRRYVLGLMADVAPEQAWGVSAAAGDGAEVALKNGWLPRVSDGGAWTVNSIGRIRGGGHDYLIAVVSEHHTSMAAGVAAVEHVSGAVVSALARASADGASSSR
jgi:beta-lactamase class A